MAAKDHIDQYRTDFLPDAAHPGEGFYEDLEPVAHEVPQMHFQTIAEFAAVDEETAKPIMGDEETCLLSHGGMMKVYGDGGAGKTTLEIDFLCHLAAGDDWLGIDVPEPVRILIIENEGPRGMFRMKLRRKLEKWQGSEIGDQIIVLEEPWAMFTFDKDAFRADLERSITHYEIDLVAAGPVQTLGIKGGGTPEEVAAFKYLVEEVRQNVERPVAALFVGHENKAGDVAGAWEGVPDTLLHLSNQGHGSTRLHWQKVRWGPALHGKQWMLAWADGETFDLVEKEVRSDSDIEADMVAFAVENPGCSWRQIRDSVQGGDHDLQRVRDALLSSSTLENRGRGNKFEIWAIGASVRAVQPALHSGFQDPRTDSAVDGPSQAVRGARIVSAPLTGAPHDDEHEELDFGGRNGDVDGDLPF